MINVRTLYNANTDASALGSSQPSNRQRRPEQRPIMLANILRRPGGLSEEPEPDPIPNSAVKLLSADGTVSQDPGE